MPTAARARAEKARLLQGAQCPCPNICIPTYIGIYLYIYMGSLHDNGERRLGLPRANHIDHYIYIYAIIYRA